MLKFREMTAEDFPLMLKWLTTPHVKEWWDDGEDTLEKVALHYGREKGIGRFILLDEADGTERKIGYFQYYKTTDDVIGIDQFIGETDYLNRGVGTEAIKLFIKFIADKYQPEKIILDPSPANKRAIKCYEKVGFRHFKTIKNENGADAYMMSFKI